MLRRHYANAKGAAISPQDFVRRPVLPQINMEMKLDEVLPKPMWKGYGAVSTPEPIVDLMIRLLNIERWENLRILEPGCGFCDFIARIHSLYPHNFFTGVEVNPQVYAITRSRFPHFNLILADFLLWEPHGLYHVVIGNPPYGIIGHESHYPLHALKERKAAYKRVTTTWLGKYNIYGAFIEKGVRLLTPTGRLALIVPATFMILDEFRRLRQFLAAFGRIKIYYLGENVFPGKNVSTCILIVERSKSGIELYEVRFPYAADAAAWALEGAIKRYYTRGSYDGGMIRFEDARTLAFERNALPLGQLFDLHFAARSPEVAKHPLVSRLPEPGLVPVLTGRNLHPGWIDHDKCYSRFWMPKEAAPSLRAFYGFPHIVVGHTKGGRVEAAVDKRCYLGAKISIWFQGYPD